MRLIGLAAIVYAGCSAADAASPEDQLFQAIERTCPEARWSHATMGAYEQPLDVAARGLSSSQAAAMENSGRDSCRGVDFGMWCFNKGEISYLASICRKAAMVRAFCAIIPDMFD